MKHGVLKSIAHNFVDSYGNGLGFMIGIYEMRVYEEAAKSEERFIEIDFLSGDVSGGPISDSLQEATQLYREELPNFCEKHGATIDDFKVFKTRFWNEYDGRHCLVTIQDAKDKKSSVEYVGDPPKKLRVLDKSGKIRTKS